MTSRNDSQGLWKRYVSRRAALRAGILGAAIPGILYVAKSAASADAADGDVYIPGAPNFLELGHGWPGKEANAGKISYRRWSDALDIVGAGTAAGYRKVKIWDDLYVQGLVNLRAYVVDPEVPPTWTAFLYARSINGQTKPFWKDTTGTAQPLVARSATLIVAAGNASPRSKLGADYVCDGTADEVEINAAIAALPASGGRVMLSEGAFNISGTGQITLASKLVLEGHGMNITNVVKAAGIETHTVELNGSGNSDVTLRGIKFDNSAWGATENWFTNINEVTRLTIDSCGFVADSTNKVGKNWINRCNNIKVINCFLQHCNGIQVTVNGVTGDDALITSEDVLFQGNIFLNMNTVDTFCIGNIANGWRIIGNYIDGAWEGIDTSFSPNVTVIGNTVKNITAGSGIYSEGGRGITIVGNTVQNCAGGGIGVSQVPDGAITPVDKPGKVVIANNVVRDCPYDSIFVLGTQRVLITGNQVFDSERHGIECEKKTINGVDYFPDEMQITNNFIYNYGTANQYAAGIACYDATNGVISGNWIDGNNNTNCYGIRDNAVSVNLIIKNNYIKNNSLNLNLVGGPHAIRDNVGYVTENNGVATITSGSTYIDVAHGLDRAPAAEDISVTPTNNLGNASKFWISDVGPSTFRINVNSTPGATTATFAWHAAVL